MTKELAKSIEGQDIGDGNTDSWCSVIYRWRNVAFMIGAVFIDSLLTWKVYLYSTEITFFIFGLSFTLIPLTILSIGLCCQHNQNNYLQGIPLINILWILTLDNNKTKIMQIALSVLMSLPQYLLNDTFILSQKKLTRYNKLQLLASYIVIIGSPLLNFSLIMFDEMKQEQLKHLNYITSSDDASMTDARPVKISNDHHDSDQYKRNKQIKKKRKRQRKKQRTCANIKLYLKVLLKTSIVVPLIFIELIHFFPVLLEYCYYQHIGITDLMGNMILFNIPKFPIAALTIWIAMEHKMAEGKSKNHKSNWCGWYFWMLCGLFLWSIITPLIVAIAVIKSEYNAHKTMLFLSISYIVTSYGGMCGWLLLSVQPRYYGLGLYTKYCIVIILCLIFIDIMVLFMVDWWEYYRKGAKTKHFISIPYDIDDEESDDIIDYEIKKQEMRQLVQ